MSESPKHSAKRSARMAGSPLFMVVSAPSGTGKTSICREFLKLCPHIRFSVSATTRLPRPGERDGVDYHFITDEAFRKQISEGEFAEWAENYGHYYGTAKKTMQEHLKAGHDLLLDIEPLGAKNLRDNYSGGIFVFVLPPSMDALKHRLGRRGENPEVMRKRLGKAMDEIKEIVWYDYIIINKDLDDAIDCLRSIYIAEKCRRIRLAETIGPFLKPVSPFRQE